MQDDFRGKYVSHAHTNMLQKFQVASVQVDSYFNNGKVIL